MTQKKEQSTAEMHLARENALRPCPTLGYDHDSIGMHLMSRGAFKIAEAEFRRAIWLNPYETQFTLHLAVCLHRQRRNHDAWKLIRELPDEGDRAIRELKHLVRNALDE